MNERGEARRSAWGGLVLAVVMVGAGCSSTSSVSFQCDQQINDSLLLTIDLIEIDDEEVKQIQEAGEDWFYSPLRKQLEYRTKTVSVRGGCDVVVDLTKLGTSEKVLKKKKGYGTLAIIAEFQDRGRSGRAGEIEFLERSRWKGKTTAIRVQETHLTLVGSR